ALQTWKPPSAQKRTPRAWARGVPGIIEQGDRHQHLRGTGPETTSGGALPRLVHLNHVVAALGQPGDPDRNDRSLGYPTLLPPSGGGKRMAQAADSAGVNPGPRRPTARPAGWSRSRDNPQAIEI